MLLFIYKLLIKHSIWKPSNYITKINILKKYPVSVYKGYNTYRGFSKNIIISTNILKIINGTNINSKLINVPRVSYDNWKDINISYWYTDNGVMFLDNEAYQTWLSLAKEVLIKYDKTISESSTVTTNQRLFSPYRLEMFNIIDCLLTKI